METSAASRARARLAVAPMGAADVRASRAASRGFTLFEMLAVLAVISVLAALATPGFVEMIRERRTQREAAMFSDVFRVARARALGRGAAVAVVVDSASAFPVAIIYEHVDAVGLPLPGCRNQGTWRLVDRINGRPGSSKFVITSPDGTTVIDQVQVCYTPRGRTFWTDNNGGEGIAVGTLTSLLQSIPDTAAPGFQNLAGVVNISVQRAEGATVGQTRSVFVMPNGLTRVSL